MSGGFGWSDLFMVLIRVVGKDNERNRRITQSGAFSTTTNKTAAAHFLPVCLVDVVVVATAEELHRVVISVEAAGGVD